MRQNTEPSNLDGNHMNTKILNYSINGIQMAGSLQRISKISSLLHDITA